MMVWSAYIFVLTCGISYWDFDVFSRLLQNCTENAGQFEDFEQRNGLHFTIFGVYGVTGVVTCLQFSIVYARNPNACRVFVAVTSAVVLLVDSVIGVVTQIFTPMKFNTAMGTCIYGYVDRHLWAYTAWPFYTATFFVFVLFSAHFYIERGGFEKRRSGQSLVSWKINNCAD